MSELPEADRREGCAHPRETFDLLGHEKAERIFVSALDTARLHHAWLITGPSGVGKATLAYRMIRKILGGQSLLEGGLDIPVSDPVAGRIAAQGHGNLHVVRRPFDTKSKRFKTEIPVAAIREMSEFFRETAAEEGRYRVGLVDKADELNRNSENAVLKLLEEPPDKGLLILLADAPGQLLPTIRSRCMQLDLRPVPEAPLRSWLKAHADLGKDFDKILWLSRGSPGRAMALAGAGEAAMKPISAMADTLASGRRVSAESALVGALSGIANRDVRSLVWGAIQDLLAEAARLSSGAGWSAPFAQPERAGDWADLWSLAANREAIEQAINLEPRASLHDMLHRIRAA